MTKEQDKLVNEALHKALKVLNCLNNDRVYETAWVKGAINACEEALALSEKQHTFPDKKQPAQEFMAYEIGTVKLLKYEYGFTYY
jgi:hypothetical protein